MGDFSLIQIICLFSLLYDSHNTALSNDWILAEYYILDINLAYSIFASPDIIDFKANHREMYRKSLTQYMGIWLDFLLTEFANSLLALLTGE